MSTQLTCSDVADYLLSLIEEDAGDLISNLKLQKLVYYAQGYHLAFFNEPLFNSTIEAWQHGPVIPELYHKFKVYGSGPISIPDEIDFEKFDDRTKDLLDQVYEVFGQYSGWKLRNMTHSEPPWKDVEINDPITQKSMKNYFEALIES